MSQPYCWQCRKDQEWCVCAEREEAARLDAEEEARERAAFDAEPTGRYVWHGDRLRAAQDREQQLNDDSRHGGGDR